MFVRSFLAKGTKVPGVQGRREEGPQPRGEGSQTVGAPTTNVSHFTVHMGTVLLVETNVTFSFAKD